MIVLDTHIATALGHDAKLMSADEKFPRYKELDDRLL
jgi:PIN domain nuclease of toxin-antitoxin system